MTTHFPRGLLALLALLALLGPWLAGSPEVPALAPSYAQSLPPGSRVEEVSLAGGGFVRAEAIQPWSTGIELRRSEARRVLDGVETVGEVRTRRLWLGSDQQGRDLLARTLAGARLSLTVALATLIMVLALSLVLGSSLALLPRALAAPLALFRDAMLSLPRVLVLLALGLVFRGSPFGVALAIALASWMLASRIVEDRVRSLVAGPLWLAARATGAPAWRAALSHLASHVGAALVPLLPLIATEAILLEATLSFLGVASGADSWGAIVGEGKRALGEAWWIALFPGLLLALTAQALALRAPSSPRPGA